MILKYDLYHFIAVAKENCFFGALPLFYIWNTLEISWSFRLVLLCEVEGHRFELAVSLKIGFEMLKQDNFFANRRRIIEESVLIDFFNGGYQILLVSHPVDVYKVEDIR